MADIRELGLILTFCLALASQSLGADAPRPQTGRTSAEDIACTTVREIGRINIRLLSKRGGVPLNAITERIKQEMRQKEGFDVRDVKIGVVATGTLLVTGLILGCADQRAPETPPIITESAVQGRIGGLSFQIINRAESVDVIEYGPGSRFETKEKSLPIQRSKHIEDRAVISDIRNILLSAQSHDFENVRLCQTKPVYGLRFRSNVSSVTAILSVDCPRLVWLQENGANPVPDELASLDVARLIKNKILSLLTTK
jgi:hypothetical protein